MKIKYVNLEALEAQLSAKQPSFWLVFGIAAAFPIAERILQIILRANTLLTSEQWNGTYRMSWFYIGFDLRFQFQ